MPSILSDPIGSYFRQPRRAARGLYFLLAMSIVLGAIGFTQLMVYMLVSTMQDRMAYELLPWYSLPIGLFVYGSSFVGVGLCIVLRPVKARSSRALLCRVCSHTLDPGDDGGGSLRALPPRCPACDADLGADHAVVGRPGWWGPSGAAACFTGGLFWILLSVYAAYSELQ
ncbi:MAG: hypothetical protein EA379_04135 [Phycisphaerales bacterium]|nr:MAG: hypothetical protein EA379_04135 [Phycisphaerales bacterium]